MLVHQKVIYLWYQYSHFSRYFVGKMEIPSVKFLGEFSSQKKASFTRPGRRLQIFDHWI